VGAGNAIKFTDVEEVRVSVKAANGHFTVRGDFFNNARAQLCVRPGRRRNHVAGRTFPVSWSAHNRIGGLFAEVRAR
jgi:hypothetical protein